MTTTALPTRRWSPARVYLLLAGAFLLAVGVAGFAAGTDFPTDPAAVHSGHEYVFGVFAVNGWHSLAGVALAVPCLAVAIGAPGWARRTALAAGAANAVVLVVFALWDPALFLVASNGADQVMHAVLAVGGLAAALPGAGRSR